MLGRSGAQEREIGVGVFSDQAGAEIETVGGREPDVAAALDDVAVGEHKPVGRDDHARADAALAPGTAADLAKARAARSSAADTQADALAPILARIDPSGAESLRTVATQLATEGVPTPSGRGEWTAKAVSRLRERLAG